MPIRSVPHSDPETIPVKSWLQKWEQPASLVSSTRRLNQSAAYIEGWLESLRKDDRLVVMAVAHYYGLTFVVPIPDRSDT